MILCFFAASLQTCPIKLVGWTSKHGWHHNIHINISININVKKANLLLESQYSKNGYYQVNRCMNLSISLHVFREITVLIINNTQITCLGQLTVSKASHWNGCQATPKANTTIFQEWKLSGYFHELSQKYRYLFAKFLIGFSMFYILILMGTWWQSYCSPTIHMSINSVEIWSHCNQLSSVKLSFVLTWRTLCPLDQRGKCL